MSEKLSVEDSPYQMLEKLSATGRYVFHGSPNRLETLEPRQQTRLNPQTNKNEPDGDPAVCTTPFFEIAIFRSLVSSQISRESGFETHKSRFGVHNQKPFFKTTVESLDNARSPKSVGYVYVFNKKDFQPYRDFEFRSTQVEKPITCVAVKGDDLPPNIELVA